MLMLCAWDRVSQRRHTLYKHPGPWDYFSIRLDSKALSRDNLKPQQHICQLTMMTVSPESRHTPPYAAHAGTSHKSSLVWSWPFATGWSTARNRRWPRPAVGLHPRWRSCCTRSTRLEWERKGLSTNRTLLRCDHQRNTCKSFSTIYSRAVMTQRLKTIVV